MQLNLCNVRIQNFYASILEFIRKFFEILPNDELRERSINRW